MADPNTQPPAEASSPSSVETWTDIPKTPPPQAIPGNPQRISLGDAAATIKAEDFLKVHEQPCARDGYMTGIGFGAAVGMLRFVLRGAVYNSASWAVGAGVLSSVLHYEYCRYRLREEKIKMKRVMEVFEMRQAKAREERLEQDRLRREAEAEKARRNRSWFGSFSR
jgi:cytochrome c oxidase assembly protein subunit 20